jgi:hypothetical protein
MELNLVDHKMSNPKVIAELFNSYFVEMVEKLIDQNSGTHITSEISNCQRIKLSFWHKDFNSGIF